MGGGARTGTLLRCAADELTDTLPCVCDRRAELCIPADDVEADVRQAADPPCQEGDANEVEPRGEAKPAASDSSPYCSEDGLRRCVTARYHVRHSGSNSQKFTVEETAKSAPARCSDMDVALVTVGDELLAGDTENTNATWLADQLTDRGVSVRRVLVVPDDEAVIADRVRAYADAFDAVLVTGGLGGTPDDVTMDAVAEAFDRELVESEEARADVEATLRAIADDYPDIDVDIEAEASIPEGGRALLNEAGLSPGAVVENVYVFPGIPREMETMFESVEDRFTGDVVSRSFRTPTPEADLVTILTTARERFEADVGCYPNRDAGYNRIKITATSDEELEQASVWLRDRIKIGERDVGR